MGGLWQYKYQLDHSASPYSPTLIARNTKIAGEAGIPRQAGAQNVSPGNGSALPGSTNTVKSNTYNTGWSASASSPGSAQAVSNTSSGSAIVTVSLSVNGSYAGKVTLPSSGNQCDVLSEARSEGVINYLDMRYDPQNKSYAVYVINNIGDSNSVWWTYTVNGGWVPGCSITPAHNNDSVNWQYIK